MITITKVEKKEPLFHKLLKKLFDFKKNIFIKFQQQKITGAVLFMTVPVRKNLISKFQVSFRN